MPATQDANVMEEQEQPDPERKILGEMLPQKERAK